MVVKCSPNFVTVVIILQDHPWARFLESGLPRTGKFLR
jgi:hypothetical protein